MVAQLLGAPARACENCVGRSGGRRVVRGVAGQKKKHEGEKNHVNDTAGECRPWDTWRVCACVRMMNALHACGGAGMSAKECVVV